MILKIVLVILVCAVVFHYLTNKSTENFGSSPTLSADFINFVGWLANDPKGYRALKSFLMNSTITNDSVQIDKPLTINGELIATGGGRFSGDKYDINSPVNINGLLTTTAGGRFSGDRYFFTDSENCGQLRIGCAWNKPGVFSEGGKTLAIGSYNRVISNLPVDILGNPGTVD